jgi:hypothetical protein
MTSTMTAPPVDQVAPNLVTRVKEGDLKTAQMALIGGGVALLAISAAWGLGADGQKRFAFSYLTAYMGVLGMCLCGLFFTMLQHITRAGWSVGVRRVAENLCGTLPLMALLFVPVLIWSHDLYHHWMGAEITDTNAKNYDKIIAGKSAWLNETSFYVRVAVYFAIWIGLATFFRNNSRKQDETGDPAISLKLSRVAAPGILLFALSITFAAFDWIMSLDPHWFSTIFGVCYFSGGFMAFLAFAILFSQFMTSRGYLREVINTEHFHDLGKLMFAFMVFWTYVNFSQYMLIWYANLPEETAWYRHRAEGGWGAVGTLLVFGHFFAPFVFLMSRHVKRNRFGLGFGAVFLLVIHWIDMQYLILPTLSLGHDHAGEAHAAHEGAGTFGHDLGVWLHGLHLYDLLCYVGLISLVAGVTLLNVRKNNLVPLRDPRLSETLNFHNI